MATTLPAGIVSLVGIILTIVIAWIIISIPIYLAGKIISGKHTTFGKAMLAAIIAPLITLFFFFLVTIGLAVFLGPFSLLVGGIIAILVLSYVYGSIFDTSLLGGFGIALLGTVITYVMAVVVVAIMSAVFGISTTPIFPGKGPPFY